MATIPTEEYSEQDDDNEREATEMGNYDEALGSMDGSLGSVRGSRASADAIDNGYFKPVKAFWKRQVIATVPHQACRDHFGMHKPSTDATNGS
jgi:hypothetical protein